MATSIGVLLCFFLVTSKLLLHQILLFLPSRLLLHTCYLVLVHVDEYSSGILLTVFESSNILNSLKKSGNKTSRISFKSLFLRKFMWDCKIYLLDEWQKRNRFLIWNIVIRFVTSLHFFQFPGINCHIPSDVSLVILWLLVYLSYLQNATTSSVYVYYSRFPFLLFLLSSFLQHG